MIAPRAQSPPRSKRALDAPAPHDAPTAISTVAALNEAAPAVEDLQSDELVEEVADEPVEVESQGEVNEEEEESEEEDPLPRAKPLFVPANIQSDMRKPSFKKPSSSTATSD
jgi:hypothetical protein